MFNRVCQNIGDSVIHVMCKKIELFLLESSAKNFQTYSDQKQKHSLITKACFEDCCIFRLVKPAFFPKLSIKSNVEKLRYCHLSGPHVP